MPCQGPSESEQRAMDSKEKSRLNNLKLFELCDLETHVRYICDKLAKDSKLRDYASSRIIRWFHGENMYYEGLTLKQQTDWMTQNLCFLCARLIEANMFQAFTNANIHKWREQHHLVDTNRIKVLVNRFFENNPKALQDDEAKEILCKNLIADAAEVHPLSNWHKKWFAEMIDEVVIEIIRGQTVLAERQMAKEAALNKLTDKEKALLGIDQ